MLISLNGRLGFANVPLRGIFERKKEITRVPAVPSARILARKTARGYLHVTHCNFHVTLCCSNLRRVYIPDHSQNAAFGLGNGKNQGGGESEATFRRVSFRKCVFMLCVHWDYSEKSSQWSIKDNSINQKRSPRQQFPPEFYQFGKCGISSPRRSTHELDSFCSQTMFLDQKPKLVKYLMCWVNPLWKV